MEGMGGRYKRRETAMKLHTCMKLLHSKINFKKIFLRKTLKFQDSPSLSSKKKKKRKEKNKKSFKIL